MRKRLKQLKEVIFDYAVYTETQHNQIHIIDITENQLGVDVIDCIYFTNDIEYWGELLNAIPYMDYYVARVYTGDITKRDDYVSKSITFVVMKDYKV